MYENNQFSMPDGYNPNSMIALSNNSGSDSNSMLKQMLMMKMQKNEAEEEKKRYFMSAIRSAEMAGDPDAKRALVKEAAANGISINLPDSSAGEIAMTGLASLLNAALLGIPDMVTGGKATKVFDQGGSGADTAGGIGSALGFILPMLLGPGAVSAGAKAFQATKSLGLGQQIRSGLLSGVKHYVSGGMLKGKLSKSVAEATSLGKKLDGNILAFEKIQAHYKSLGVLDDTPLMTDINKGLTELKAMKTEGKLNFYDKRFQDNNILDNAAINKKYKYEVNGKTEYATDVEETLSKLDESILGIKGKDGRKGQEFEQIGNILNSEKFSNRFLNLTKKMDDPKNLKQALSSLTSENRIYDDVNKLSNGLQKSMKTGEKIEVEVATSFKRNAENPKLFEYNDKGKMIPQNEKIEINFKEAFETAKKSNPNLTEESFAQDYLEELIGKILDKKLTGFDIPTVSVNETVLGQLSTKLMGKTPTTAVENLTQEVENLNK